MVRGGRLLTSGRVERPLKGIADFGFVEKGIVSAMGW